MTALAQAPDTPTPNRHLRRDLCAICHQPVMWILVNGTPHLADLYEWQPRMACPSCLQTRRAHPGARTVHCSKCANTGYVGTDRPPRRMLAIDVAWSDDDDQHLHARIIGPTTDRRKGEALHPFHVCNVPAAQPHRRAA